MKRWRMMMLKILACLLLSVQGCAPKYVILPENDMIGVIKKGWTYQADYGDGKQDCTANDDLTVLNKGNYLKLQHEANRNTLNK